MSTETMQFTDAIRCIRDGSPFLYQLPEEAQVDVLGRGSFYLQRCGQDWSVEAIYADGTEMTVVDAGDRQAANAFADGLELFFATEH